MAVLDWKQNQDLRSFAYMHEATTPSVSRSWLLGKVLDQGQDGSCTGHGFAAAVSSKHPGVNHHTALAYYELATSRDTYPGDWPTADTGSSVNGVMRAGRDLTLVSSYAWCKDAGAVADAIVNTGPVVIGIAWHASMDTSSTTVLNVDTSTPVRGGHCVCLYSWNATVRQFGLRNSWGTSWANEGNIQLRFEDLDALLAEGGEASVPHIR